MKILSLLYDHTENPWVGGGGAVRAREILSRLALRGHEITMLSGSYPGASDHEYGGVRYIFRGSSANYLASTFSYAQKAASHIRHHGADFDLIIEDFAPWNPVFSRWLTKTPVVLQLHHREGMNINRRWPVVGFPFYLIEALYPRMFDNVITVSESTRGKFRVPRAEVIPNGIDSSLLDTEREEAGFLLFLGRLEINNKGLDTLIEAMKRLGGNARLVLAGRGRDEERLKQMASGLPVEFRGFVNESEKRALMSSCLALVLPSRFEGWGMVVMEAAACGAPVVVSSIPELDYAQKGGFGFPFATGDAEALTAALRKLIDEPALRSGLSGAGRAVAASYTWSRITDEFERYIYKIADGYKK